MATNENKVMDTTYMLKGADAESVNRWSPFVSEYLAQWIQIEATILRTNLE
jgi:alkyl sulfatase BDS1-like metallo-beta-lactamase superfamily hydrolase